MEKKQKMMALFVGVAIIVLSVQVAAASTYCPSCQVQYNVQGMTVNTPASTPQETSTHVAPVALLDPSTAFTSQSQVNIADIVLKLL